MTNTPSLSEKFLNFSKYARRHELARFLVQYELFKKVQNIKGSIVECGVYQGSGIMAFAKISEALEPYNFLRKIIGFDTFAGFPSIAPEDVTGSHAVARVGHMALDYDILAELKGCIDEFEATRLLKHQEKIQLIQGDAVKTIPEFLAANQHTIVSLLYLDIDLYEPTLIALREFLPRMPKGAIIAFDELNDPKSPGETKALLDTFKLRDFQLECFPFEPHVSWITL